MHNQKLKIISVSGRIILRTVFEMEKTQALTHEASGVTLCQNINNYQHFGGTGTTSFSRIDSEEGRKFH